MGKRDNSSPSSCVDFSAAVAGHLVASHPVASHLVPSDESRMTSRERLVC